MKDVKKRIKALAHSIFHLNDTPHGIAWGVALGMFFSILPTFGLGMIVALALSSFVKANPVSTYLGTLVVNPFNGALVYALDYWVGSFFLGETGVFFVPQNLKDLEILGGRLYLGGILVSSILSSVSYLIILGFLQWKRQKR
ncbi:MAG TPA: DUF2062 domain-containing protein [Anaerolineae bacterium]|nr:DUF2062 domain-containing protein [Anaerolineae bacterium]